MGLHKACRFCDLWDIRICALYPLVPRGSVVTEDRASAQPGSAARVHAEGRTGAAAAHAGPDVRGAHAALQPDQGGRSRHLLPRRTELHTCPRVSHQALHTCRLLGLHPVPVALTQNQSRDRGLGTELRGQRVAFNLFPTGFVNLLKPFKKNSRS